VILTGVGIALAPSEHRHLTRRELTIGLLAGILAALGGAGGAVMSRKAYAVLHATGEFIHPVNAGFQRVLGGCLISGISLLFVKRGSIKSNLTNFDQSVAMPESEKWRKVWFWILLNSLAGQTLGVSCMQWAFETTPTGIVLPIIAMSPIVVIPIAYFFEGERPSVRSIVGGLVAVAGVIALTRCR
jgi:drug/metabolite transporter (DMT)-like permease